MLRKSLYIATAFLGLTYLSTIGYKSYVDNIVDPLVSPEIHSEDIAGGEGLERFCIFNGDVIVTELDGKQVSDPSSLDLPKSVNPIPHKKIESKKLIDINNP